jgi:uncharacterized repeat protein (TIGR01451 family)
VVNVATGKGTSPDPDQPDVPVTPGTDPEPTDDLDTTLTVVKTSDVAEGTTADIGQEITFTITVTNEGNVDYPNVVVVDELVNLNETIALLPAGESVEFTVTYTVAPEDITAGSVVNVATASGDPIDDPKNPDEPQTPEDEDQVEVPTTQTYTLIVHYWVNATEAFNDFYAVYNYGAFYYVVSPNLPGYTPSQAVVEGNITGNTELNVYYNANLYTLTINYVYLDGTPAAPSVIDQLPMGAAFDEASPAIPGFTPNMDRVQGVMPNRNETITVFYVGDGGIIIPDYGTPLGLGNVSLNAGECIE